MERVIKIQSTIKIDNVMPSSFTLKGNRRTLIGEFQYIDRKIDDTANMSEMLIPFTSKSSEKLIKYQIDENGSPLTAIDQAIKKTIEDFYCLHPLTLINGKPHPNTISGGVIYYDIIDVDKKVVTDWKKWNNKLKVMSDIVSKSLAEIRDICFYYGLPPKGKTKGALIIELADYNSGLIFRKNGDIDKAEHYISTFITNQDPDKVYTVNCRKALDYNVITERIGDGGQRAYYLGNELMGTTFEDIVKFCKQNDDIYQKYILKGVKESDNFTSEENSSELEKRNMYGDAELGYMEVETFRNEVLQLFDKAYNVLGKNMTIKKNSIINSGVVKLREQYDLMNKQMKDAAGQPA